MKLRKLIFPAMVLVCALAIAAVPGFAISKEFNQSYPLQPGGKFELQNVNGTVEVQGWDRDVVEVHAVKTAKLKESDLERVSIDVTTGSSTTRAPRDPRSRRPPRRARETCRTAAPTSSRRAS